MTSHRFITTLSFCSCHRRIEIYEQSSSNWKIKENLFSFDKELIINNLKGNSLLKHVDGKV